MRFKKLISYFKKGNVCVCGLRGTGKDMLFSNVIIRRKENYISNIDYTSNELFYPLDYNKLNTNNNYDDLINGNISYYEFPYPNGSDVYISDVGIYLPSQYCNQLNNNFKYLPTYFALSRQLSNNNVHINVQNLNRAWDKIREQSDIYIMCLKCIVIGKLVIQFIRTYDKYESCINRVKPCRISRSIFNKDSTIDTYLDNYYNTHGDVKNHFLIYFNKSSYDTYYFKNLFKKGVKK